MIKKIWVVTAVCMSIFLNVETAYAGLGFMRLFLAQKHEKCPKGYPADHEKFCGSFREAAQCYCSAAGLPKSMCQDMETIHHRMLLVFDTQLKACQFQKDTETQHCMDSWNCYRSGGRDSQGRLCGAAGKSCSVRPMASTH